MNANKILILEDDKAARRILEKGFTLAGFKTHSVETCEAALKLIKELKFDCLLLDYYLDDGTALDICKKVRSNEKTKKIPIVVLSGHTEKSLSSYADGQADFFVAKDKTCSEVIAIIESLLRRLEWERGILKKSDITLDPESLSILFGKNRVIQLSLEQFRFFSIIFKKSPEFVDEDVIIKDVFDSDSSKNKNDALIALAFRLRQKLGKQLARRIKSNRRRGWIYVGPKPH
ncbi:MAG: response regulator [Elusimicrobiota bacterium]|nr:response regulator [Elusimicrobiota bacterium]